jgi:hypothetical protein
LGIIAALGQGGGAALARKAFDVAHQVGQRIDGGTAAYQRILAGLSLTAVVLLINRWRKPRIERGSPSDCGRDARNTTSVTDHPWRRAWPWVVANALGGLANRGAEHTLMSLDKQLQ